MWLQVVLHAFGLNFTRWALKLMLMDNLFWRFHVEASTESGHVGLMILFSGLIRLSFKIRLVGFMMNLITLMNLLIEAQSKLRNLMLLWEAKSHRIFTMPVCLMFSLHQANTKVRHWANIVASGAWRHFACSALKESSLMNNFVVIMQKTNADRGHMCLPVVFHIIDYLSRWLLLIFLDVDIFAGSRELLNDSPRYLFSLWRNLVPGKFRILNARPAFDWLHYLFLVRSGIHNFVIDGLDSFNTTSNSAHYDIFGRLK